MPRTAGSKLKPIAKPPEQPEVMYALDMREKTHGVWRRRPGTWVSITAWTIDLTQEEYATLNHTLAALRAPEKAAHAA